MRPIGRVTAATFVALSLFTAFAAHAETITLMDGTKLTGDILHSYKGEYTVKTAQGELTLDKSKIKSIAFEAPVARAIYSTPEKTLDAWRSATMNADDRGMIDAYAMMYQGMVSQEMGGMDFKAKSSLVADVGKTKFTVKERKVEKEKAVLTVAQEKDGETRSGDIKFVLENGEWKMTP